MRITTRLLKADNWITRHGPGFALGVWAAGLAINLVAGNLPVVVFFGVGGALIAAGIDFVPELRTVHVRIEHDGCTYEADTLVTDKEELGRELPERKR